MPATAAQIDELSQLIAQHVPEDLLSLIVRRHGLIPNFDEWQKTKYDEDRGRLFGLSRSVVEAYDGSGELMKLATTLMRQVYWSPDFLRALTPFSKPEGASPRALQAFHRRRDNLIRLLQVERLVNEIKSRVCCILVEYLDEHQALQTEFGTGFLVAPDLILTAHHVVAPILDAGGTSKPNTNHAVYFDYLDEPKISGTNAQADHYRKVKFADNWYVLGSPYFPDDGLQEPTDANGLIQILTEHLDFALIKLAAPVGNEAVSAGGGARRGWIEIPKDVPMLGVDSRVIVVQHAGGEPQQLDFGRLTRLSAPRFWYDTETDFGTSGAPCLSRELALIGVHNAELVPLHFNQGIPISAIMKEVEAQVDLSLKAKAPPAEADLWNLAPEGERPRLLFGRSYFLQWIKRAQADVPARRSDRLYAADAPGDGVGKSFSIEVLRRVLLGKLDQRLIAFGTSDEMLPMRVEDMIRVLADHLGVPAARLSEMPTRPDAQLPAGALDGDKLKRWASESVPNWFATILEECRPKLVDLREEAIAQRNRLQADNLAVPPQLNEDADSAEPILVDRGWKAGWIALNRITSTKLPAEIVDLIAGLAGTTQNEADVSPSLRRLRWLFLGYRPDFIRTGDVSLEQLRYAVRAEDIDNLLTAAWASRGVTVADGKLTVWRETIQVFIEALDQTPETASMRLQQLQFFGAKIIKTFLP